MLAIIKHIIFAVTCKKEIQIEKYKKLQEKSSIVTSKWDTHTKNIRIPNVIVVNQMPTDQLSPAASCLV